MAVKAKKRGRPSKADLAKKAKKVVKPKKVVAKKKAVKKKASPAVRKVTASAKDLKNMVIQKYIDSLHTAILSILNKLNDIQDYIQDKNEEKYDSSNQEDTADHEGFSQEEIEEYFKSKEDATEKDGIPEDEE